MKTILMLSMLLLGCKSGPQGDTGPAGATGPKGDQGSPGTTVGMVEFCQNVTPSYPATFPEYGFCINQQVYAVYSANDGFLTLLPSGTYQSKAIGSSCTFTIGKNCEVTQ